MITMKPVHAITISAGTGSGSRDRVAGASAAAGNVEVIGVDPSINYRSIDPILTSDDGIRQTGSVIPKMEGVCAGGGPSKPRPPGP
ncbi:hypothetical protein [Streptomyces violaceusniger]|uniref:hypothetical protein n=1 Tax=Streptomyces violaceusniger TaxID=68280 RepID=UPI0013F3EACA